MASIALAPVVSFDGSSLSASWLAALVELRVERQYQVPARVTFRFTDPGYVLLASQSVILGTSVKVTDAADSSLVLIEAEVTSIAVDQRAGEQPELVVVAHDKSHRLGRATNVKTYVEMTYSDVVADIATRASLSPTTDSTSLTLDYLMQVDSDIGLLTELARRVGFDWWVDGSTLYFQKPSSSGTTVDLALGDGLLSFSARASGHAPDEVTVDGWDRGGQSLVTATAASASDGITATSDFAGLISARTTFGSATVVSGGLSAMSDTEATQLSQALLDRAVACAVTAQGVASGTGQLKLGTRAKVSQAGPLNGEYPVTRVEHLFRPRTGFVTRFFSGERQPSTLVDTLSGARSAATPATMHAGLSVGQVTNAKDPNKQGRVKVKYPGLSSEYESDWARTVALGGGSSRGAVFIPEVNDEVLVAFEGGDPRQPVVIGGLYGSQTSNPTPTVDDGTGTVTQRGMTSRLGHVVGLIDGQEPANQAILLQLAGGNNTIHLGKDKLSITVPSGTPIEITAGSSSLKFGDDGSVTLSAPSVSITGEQKIALSAPEIDLNADAQLNLQSDGTAGLKGATVQLQSEGPASITGEPVSIN